ncbi:MAG TPA: hypothetical protein VF469_33360, partial [Kofleriaceae bacterium]
MAVVVCAVVLGTGGVASAGRKRVVVLDFEGPKGEKFHDDLVSLIKKTHTVVPTEKWNGAAAQLAAATLSDKNIKKVARKLKIDAVVEGKVEKRRDEFILRLKLYEGRTGERIGDTIDTKAEGPRIDGRAQRDLKDELVGAIDNVEANHVSGGGDDEDDTPVGKKAKKPSSDDEDDDKSAKKGKKPGASADEDEDDKPARGKFGKRNDDERGTDKVDRKGKKPGAAAISDDDDKPVAKKPAAKPSAAGTSGDDDDKPVAKKPTRKPDEVAAAARPARKTDDEPRKVTRPTKADDGDDDARPTRSRKVADSDDGGSAEAEADTVQPLDARTARSAGERALDAVFGLSLTMRRMSFAISPALRARPPGYAGIPVAGAILDATVYPLALGHDRADQLKNLGLELLYDRVLKLNSKDPMTGNVYSTIESRFGLTAVFRHAFGQTATAPVVLGSLGYNRQSFNVLGKVDLPDVKYSIIAPGAGLRFPLNAKLGLGADLKLLIITDAGQIQDPDQYGAATVLGFEGSASADYLIKPNLFVRAALRVETIGYTFKGTGEQTNNRDGMPMTQDVAGARDSYFGGMVTV